MKWLSVIAVLVLLPLVAYGDGGKEVSVCEVFGGVTRATTFTTTSTYVTQPAPTRSGYVFVGWTISTLQSFVSRDRYGRSLEVVSAVIYEDTVFTAHYLPESQDDDGDGIADGYEQYWYGDLDEMADSDTDGDGFTFAEEIAYGTNPLVFDEDIDGAIVWGGSAFIQYNPDNLMAYVIRSEPEGELFATISDYTYPGDVILTSPYSPLSSSFAYWTVNGVRVSNRFGRSAKQVSIEMPLGELEVVAVCCEDNDARMGLYWYGSSDIDQSSDTDGDGFTFAEELEAGTNPLVFDEDIEGGISWVDSELILYNPDNHWPYKIYCEPEGKLFATVLGYRQPGATISTSVYSPLSSAFAYWTVNGVRQSDRFGRAVESVSVVMPAEDLEIVAVCRDNIDDRMGLYWYGEYAASDSDTDGDGLTFEEEIAAGTNPLVFDEDIDGAIVWRDSTLLSLNLQTYEQVVGAVIDNEFVEFFTSPIAGNEAQSETFGEDLQPIVLDLNGDGLFDLVLVYKGGYKTFINVGYHGNPEFEERKDIALDGVDVDMNDVSRLAGLTLDVAVPEDALSATTNGVALLVSDSAGRIWYYVGNGEPGTGNGYKLQHKVWGGSHAGFAEGLRLAAVDWDEDGDLDCLAGTSAGKLMLLRDPKVGRPTNLKAEAGVDTVVLTWDPNQQSRIRGYRLYRASGESEDFARIAEPQLPTHRDQPPEITTYDYKVSSVSRFYTAGNSTPTITESPATEPVRATLGGVAFDWHDVNAKVGERVEVVISIENALNYNVVGKIQTVTYDPEYLMPVKVVKSGLTENIEMTDSAQDGSWTVTMTSGVLPAGSGRFLTFVFNALKEGETTVGGATVTISAASHYFLGDVDGNGEVNELDLRLLAKLKSAAGRKYTADQLKAGDFNGNGKLDDADYQALRKLLKDNRKL